MARPHDELRLKPRLFGKFCAPASGGGALRTLFIKLQFILRQQRHSMVNAACAFASL
jgi:hypothetical protein